MFRFIPSVVKYIVRKLRRAIQEIQYRRLRRQLTPEDIATLMLIARSITGKA